MIVLAGDVGGTKVRLGLFRYEADHLELLRSERFVSAEFPSLSAVVSKFLGADESGGAGRVEAACFGIPGPVFDGRVKLTNLPWEITENEFRQLLKVTKVRLVNDLVATAAGIPVLDASSVIELYAGDGTPIAGDVSLVVAPGTGLGQAMVVREESRYVYLASEGGHANFAAMTEQEFELTKYLQKKLGHASVESVLSGPGLLNIYSFLRDTGVHQEPAELRAELEKGDKAAAVTRGALSGTYPICVEALDMMCYLWGAHASNVLLTTLATRGVYLGGGVTPRVAPALSRGFFLKGYLAKNKCRDRVAATPVFIVQDDTAALKGAAHIAGCLLT